MGFAELAGALGAKVVDVGADGDTNLVHEAILSVIAETRAAANGIGHVGFKRSRGTLDLSTFAGFTGARVVVDTHSLAFDDALKVLEKTDLALEEFATALEQVLATADAAEANVGLAFTPVEVTDSPFVMNESPVPEGTPDQEGTR